MLDEKDLMAIGQLIDQKLAQQKDEIFDRMDQRLEQQKDEIFGRMDQRLEQQKDEIFGRMDQRLEQQKDEIFGRMDQRLEQQKDEILAEATHQMKVLLDLEVKPQFNLLAEELSIIREKMIPESRIEAIEDDVAVLKAAVRQINRELRELKKAQ